MEGRVVITEDYMKIETDDFIIVYKAKTEHGKRLLYSLLVLAGQPLPTQD